LSFEFGLFFTNFSSHKNIKSDSIRSAMFLQQFATNLASVVLLSLLWKRTHAADTRVNLYAFSNTLTLGEMTLVTGLADGDGDGLVPVFLPFSEAGTLLTLNRLDRGVYVPFGRSYDGNSWERVAGLEETLDNICVDNVLSGHCDVDLPFENDPIAEYYLTKYNHSTSERAELARFLQRSTFGPTTAEINGWDSSSGLVNSMANWLLDQIENQGTSSHREYYRKRLNPRSIETYKYGISGPAPCEENSRWRKFAFTRNDLRLSSYEQIFDVEITSSTNGGVTGYVLSFANYVRTVLYEPLEYYGKGKDFTVVEGQLNTNSSYKLCYVEEIKGSVRSGVNDVKTFGLEVNGECRFIKGGE
jgi:hypothetical protein